MRPVPFVLQSLCLPAAAIAASLQGFVTEVRESERSLVVDVAATDHAAIEAGSRHTFKVSPGDLAVGYGGKSIRAEIVKFGDGWMLQTIWPEQLPEAKPMADLNRQLHAETAALSRRNWLREGDYVPAFALFDQQGDIFMPRQLQGRYFVMNFIFTRCTVARMCPASTTRMAELQDAAREAGIPELSFVTLSFDPEYDTPGILNQYAQGYGIEGDNFHLLTGPEQTVNDLLRQFGIRIRNADGTIDHTMATVLVDPTGKIIYRREGSTWTTQEFLEVAQEAIGKTRG